MADAPALPLLLPAGAAPAAAPALPPPFANRDVEDERRRGRRVSQCSTPRPRRWRGRDVGQCSTHSRIARKVVFLKLPRILHFSVAAIVIFLYRIGVIPFPVLNILFFFFH